LMAAGLGGCFMPSDRQLDEQKDQYFIAGKAALNRFDYKGAAQAFEKALEVNPRSASAHFELGVLYEQKLQGENNYAIAIYHYNRFLQLRPDSEYAGVVTQRIMACKTELAKPIIFPPGSQALQREMEQLKVENAQLKTQIEAWRAYAASLASGAKAQAPPVPVAGGGTPVAQGQGPVSPGPPAPATLSSNAPVSRAPAAGMRQYSVQSGDTPTSIARKHNVSLNALLSANPGVDPRHLKIGQVLKIPPASQ